MGGTSTDVCLVDARRGGLHISTSQWCRAFRSAFRCSTFIRPARGAGRWRALTRAACCAWGRSRQDPIPGPICFGRGEQAHGDGREPDAGRLDPERFLGGAVQLDRRADARIHGKGEGPLATVEDFAAGILRVVETSMEKAIRVISVERGYDPRDFTLVAFGGGGPLHACSLARALRVPRVLIPALPGAFRRWAFCWPIRCGNIRAR